MSNGNRGFFNKIFPTIWTHHTLFCSAPLYPEISNKWFLLNVISPRIKVVLGPILHSDESLLFGILFALDFPGGNTSWVFSASLSRLFLFLYYCWFFNAEQSYRLPALMLFAYLGNVFSNRLPILCWLSDINLQTEPASASGLHRLIQIGQRPSIQHSVLLAS